MVLAKFKEYKGDVIFINPSQVRFIKKDASSGYAIILFDIQTSVVVNESPEAAAKILCNAVSA